MACKNPIEARNAERERLRNLAREQLTEADAAREDLVDQRAKELERAKLSGAGRKGGRETRRLIELGRRYELLHTALLETAENLVDLIRDASPVDPATCDHVWPDELTDSALCDLCALAYSDWSQPEPVAA